MTVYKLAARAVVVAIGAVYAWRYRYFVNPDAVAYLDVADRYLASGWSAMIHPHRGPLYPWLLAVANRALNAGAYYESTIAHAVTFLMYCAAFAAYEYLLRQLRAAKGIEGMPDAFWIPLAYGLFLWCCNFADQTGPDVLTPDLLVAAAVFLGSALLVRIANGQRDWATYAALGGTLGVGYLAKEAMMPLGIITLVVAAFAGSREGLRRVVVAAALFVAIAGAYFVPLSLKLGRPSTGETAGYNYILWVSSEGKPANPRPVIVRAPLIVGYPDAAGRGAYAVHDDLRFWLAGLRPRIEVRAQLRAIRRSVEDYSEILRTPLHFALLIVFLTHALSSANRRDTLRRCWYLTVPSLLALGMFGVVLVQPRYVGPSIVILWIGLFAGFGPESYRLATHAMTAAWVAVLIVVLTARESRSQMQQLQQPAIHENWLLAEHLARRGVSPEDRVAVVGDPYMCYWARLAKVRIVAEVVNPPDFRIADARARAEAEAALQRFGVRAIVADHTTQTAPACWEAVNGTPYSVCVLPAPVAWRARS